MFGTMCVWVGKECPDYETPGVVKTHPESLHPQTTTFTCMKTQTKEKKTHTLVLMLANKLTMWTLARGHLRWRTFRVASESPPINDEQSLSSLSS